MENWKIIVLIVILTFLIGMAYIVIKLSLKEYEERVFVYPKTGHQYMPLYKCKMKDFTTGEWKDAIIYRDGSSNYYVREKSDFFNKFVKLLDWKDGN